MFRGFNKKGAPILVGVSVLAASQASFAAGLSDITAAVSGADAIAGITAVAVVIGGILAIRMGARKILGMIK